MSIATVKVMACLVFISCVVVSMYLGPKEGITIKAKSLDVAVEETLK